MYFKQYGKYRLSAINDWGGGGQEKIPHISLNLKSNLESIQILSKGLRKSPFLI
jgi:hypothetical protein